MIKKDAIYKWDKREKDAFSCIKHDTTEARALYNLELGKYFLLYAFASDTSLFVVLTQKDELDNERHISFMSAFLQRPKLNYPFMEK